jgi:hypothetical protein
VRGKIGFKTLSTGEVEVSLPLEENDFLVLRFE